MPNGHGPQPELDVTNPGSLGHYLGWMGAVLGDTHDRQGTFQDYVRDELQKLNEWKDEIELRDGKAAAVLEAKAEARAARRRQLSDAAATLGAVKWIIAAGLVGAGAGVAGVIAVYNLFAYIGGTPLWN